MSWSVVASSFAMFLLVACCYAEKAPYTSFTQDATLTPLEVYYDYIIVGGGTAGCSLAATLSTKARVLVLERGGLPYNIPAINKTGTISNLLDTSPTSPAQLFISTDGTYSHRGRVLGGTSAINWGFYSRASDKEVRQNGWDPQLVIESYQWVENKLVSEPQLSEWQSVVRSGLLEAGVTPNRGFTYEHLNGTKTGGSTFDKNGRRHGATDLLEYADPNNINVYLHATVHKILFHTTPGERPKAKGVLFKDSNGVSHKAYLNNKTTSEIILSAGAIGSPQLLMLSGIGPIKELNAQKIDVILVEPNVGNGMCDNPANAIVIPSPRPIEMSLVDVVGIDDSCYYEASSGFVELNLAPIEMAEDVISSANQTINQIFTKASVVGFGLNSKPNTQTGLIWQKVAVPYSTGLMELETGDPNDNPRVTFNYYQDPRDLKNCIKGMEIVKRVVESKSFSRYRTPFQTFESYKNLMWSLPMNKKSKHFITSTSMKQFCIDTVVSSWHYHGGCHVGKVVDHDYKVLGIDSLRVIDGSTFLNSPGTNPQATVMMLGRYMGQRILIKLGTH